MSSKIKRLVRIADEKAHALVSPMRKNTDEGLTASYRRSVFEWKHTYAAWIQENEKVSADKKAAEAPKNGTEEDAFFYGATVLDKAEITESFKVFLEMGGEWVAYCTESGYFAENIVEYVSEALADMSDKVGIIYGDEDYVYESDSLGMRVCPFFKPDYSQETLLSFSYFGELLFLKKTIAEKILGAGACVETINYADALTLYDIALKASEIVGREGVGHINHIAFHRSAKALMGDLALDTGCDDCYERYDKAEGLVSAFLEEDANIGKVLVGCGEDGIDLRKAALERRGLLGEFVKASEGDLYRIRYISGDSKVSVVILSKDNPDLLEKCVDRIRSITDYSNYEIIVVDNGSNGSNKERVQTLSDKYNFSYYHHPMEFNFSALCNFGVEKSDGELILLMNDDVEVIDGEYMKLMAGLAKRAEIGAVGARLRYGDGISIQHVGVTSLGIGPSHQLQKKSDDKNRYYGRNRADYEMLGVTAACLMVKRSAYERIGGLDEGLKVAYNDVDFCMKLVEAGYINMQCNGAVLLHHESLTRGFDGDSDDKWNRLLSEKEGLYSRHPRFKAYDPYHSASLIDNSSEYICSHKTPSQDFEWRSKVQEISEEKSKSFGFRVRMDHSVLQRRFNPEDEDFFWIDGWIYVPGADHVLLSKGIVLRNIEDGKNYEVSCCDVYREDVEAMLPAAKNIAMAGFLARVSPSDLPKGNYEVGVVLKSAGRESCIWTGDRFARK